MNLEIWSKFAFRYIWQWKCKYKLFNEEITKERRGETKDFNEFNKEAKT